MVYLKPKCLVFAVSAVIFGENRTNAFVTSVPRSRIGGGNDRNAVRVPLETLSFASLFQKPPKDHQHHSQRMSEARFRLELIQGIRPPYKNVPIHDPVEEDQENTQDDVDFVYGRDSTCYRGLSKPTKAGLALALILTSGMIVTSPELQNTPLSSLPSLLEGSRHLLGETVTSELNILFERLAFQFDMLGTPEYAHEVSNQVAAYFNSEVFPYVSHLRHNLQEATVVLPEQCDIFLAQIASEVDSMKDEFASQTASSEAVLNQVLVNAKSFISQQSNEWQLAYHTKSQQFNHHITQSTLNLLDDVNQVMNKRKELFEGKLVTFHHTSQAKIEQLGQNFIQESEKLRSQGVEHIALSKDAIKLKSLDFQQACQTGIDEMKRETLQMNKKVQEVANVNTVNAKNLLLQKYGNVQYAITERSTDLKQRLLGEVAKCREMVGTLVPQQYSKFEKYSHATTIEFEKNIAKDVENIQSTVAKAGTDFEMKRRGIDTELGPMIQFLRQSLHNKMVSFRDAGSVNLDQTKNHVACQGRVLFDTLPEALHKWKESAANVLSSTKNAVTEQIAFTSHPNDSMTTESAFLKTILNGLVY